MIDVTPLDIGLARQWVNFCGKSEAAAAFAETQLQGAVALHNLLARERFGYLADEVGMGKTYVAIGAMALMRRQHPGLRVLYIAPKANIQQNWFTTLRNFASNNSRADDGRVRTFGGAAAFPVVSCENLRDMAVAATVDSQRDFLVRMTSFSFGLSEKLGWAARRDDLLKMLPWLDRDRFQLYSKEAFKDAYARAVNAVLPKFDLVIVDEGHNLKHGYGQHASARNRLLGLVLGREDASAPMFPGGGPRADRILVLSATPVEHDFADLWRQMDVLGFGGLAPGLKDADKTDSERQDIASQFMVRRLTRISVAGEQLTKNLYRREWRGGGVDGWDTALPLADARQRLIVALVQKRVTDVLARNGEGDKGGFKRSFQIGMLASFESFFQTSRARVRQEEGEQVESSFEESDQTRREAEKQGIDARSIDQLAESWQAAFHRPMPHPKMDAVAAELAAGMLAGHKTLVFVRRIASVPELTQKVGHLYDDWLLGYLLAGTGESLGLELRRAFAEYRESKRPQAAMPDAEAESEAALESDEEPGGVDTFFAWFFRGLRKPTDTGYRSLAATFRKNRLRSEGSRHATLLDDNHVIWLLGGDRRPLLTLQRAHGVDVGQLRPLAWRCFRRARQGRFPRSLVFAAYQEAALHLLVGRGGDIGRQAGVILRAVYPKALPDAAEAAPDGFPEADEPLSTVTLFTELESRPDLRREIWPTPESGEFLARFFERERRRQLFVSSVVLGHPFVDLWLAAIRRVGSLEAGEREEDAAGSLAIDFLDRLESQRGSSTMCSWRELHDLANQFHLLVDVNFSDIQDQELWELPGYLKRTLGRQSPVGGMWGGVNKQLVSQFRMPGYPYVLVTTDVLREGENLHTFCSRVMHYGIGWTPSAMEQRTGRVDRIGSLTHRRLANAKSIQPEELLQVYYPHLRDTVERVQVREVYRRMNRFIDLLHERTAPRAFERSHIDLGAAMLEEDRDVATIPGLLQTRFEVRPDWLTGLAAADPVTIDLHLRAFSFLLDGVAALLPIVFAPSEDAHVRLGTLGSVRGKGLPRQQPFQLRLRLARDSGQTMLRVTSPVGLLRWGDAAVASRILDLRAQCVGVALCAASRDAAKSYDLSTRVDLPFRPGHAEVAEVADAVSRACRVADLLEEAILAVDRPLADFERQLRAEVVDG